MRIKLAVLVVLLAVVAAACGGDDDADSTTNTSGELGEGAAIATPDDLPDLSGESLTFVAFGGQGQELQAQAWIDPFAEATGADVRQDSPSDIAKLVAQVESGNVDWDVVATDPYFPQSGCGEIAEKIDIDLSALDQRYVTDECSVPVDRFTYHLVYNEELFGDDPPTGWDAYFDTEKYPGKRGIWSYVGQNQLEFALLADGVAPDDVYPIDIPRAIAKLDTIKDDVVPFDTLAQSVEQVLADEVVMSIMVNTRSYAAIAQGAHFTPMWKNNIQSWDSFIIPKGSKNKEAAEAFLQFLTTETAQQNILNVLPFAPTREGSFESGNAELIPFSPGSDEVEQDAILQDQDYYAEHFEEVNEAYNAWLAG